MLQMTIDSYRKQDTPPAHTLIQGPVIRLVVGKRPESKTYFAHKAMLCHYSAYFGAALSSRFAEGKVVKGIQTVKLDDENALLFDRVYYCLYSGTILTEAEMRDYNMQPMLVDLWIFADRRMMPALQNAALDAINRNSCVTGKLCEISLIHVLFNTAPKSSKVRAWIVEQLVRVKNLQVLFDRDVPEEWNFPSMEFLTALTLRSNELLSGGKKLIPD